LLVQPADNLPDLLANGIPIRLSFLLPILAVSLGDREAQIWMVRPDNPWAGAESLIKIG
jgi:hypothetical protein